MNNSNKLFFYLPIFLIMIGLYRNSWLPGGHMLQGKETVLIFFISCIYIILIFDFKTVLNTPIGILKGYNKYITLLFILFFISVLFYNIQEVTKFSNLIRLLDFIFYFIIFFFIFPKVVICDPSLFKRFVLIICFTGFVTAVFGLILLFLGINPDAQFSGALVSFIDQPNYVPFIFNLGIISTIYYLDWQKRELSPLIKIFYTISIILQLVALLLTFSRGAYLGLSVGLVLYFFFKYRHKILLLIPVFAGVMLFVIPPFFKAKGFASFMSRFYLLVPAYIMLMKSKISLLWGFGASNALDAFIQYNNMYNLTGDLRESELNNPHNAIVSLVLMFGLIFTIVIITFISIMMIKTSFYSLKENNFYKKLFHGFLVSIISALIFQSFFDSEITLPEFFSLQLMLIFLGLTYRILMLNYPVSFIEYISKS